MPTETNRLQISISGIVQGVGFRPFVYKLASQHRLTGFVANTPQGVIIEAEGLQQELDTFLQKLKRESPPLAVVNNLATQSISNGKENEFTIHSSRTHGYIATQISPDAATCSDCVAELFNPGDRRYHYPFINCTNCGPRYTIIENIPYDRPSTSMRHFVMCSDCLTEYNDPANRRFHAQPNCCSVCGPQISLSSSEQHVIATEEDAIVRAKELLHQGFILAIKGLGGFHLAVDASNKKAVANLRKRKGREEKPFAVMVSHLKTAHKIAHLQPEDIQILTSFKSPIVLVPKMDPSGLADTVAPQNEMFGIMLPYTPLHHLLFDGGPEVLVMTSANLSDEPLCIENHDAFRRLDKIADAFLTHNRPIYMRNDDSIVMNMAGKRRVLRRSRGFVPQGFSLQKSGATVLALGGELKSTVCLLKNNKAIISQHIGDLKNLAAYEAFKKTIAHLLLVYEAQPELIIHDLHPQYLSTRWAMEHNNIPTLAVQHHHAHLAACLAENNITGPAIGLIMDGSGFGSDQTIWGGEVLIGDASTYRRYGHFEPLPLPGGDKAVQEPWRIAAAWLSHFFNGNMPNLPFLTRHTIEPITEITAKKIHSPLTSSCGRVFDAVAAMSGGREVIKFEAQAAIEFMQAAGGQLKSAYGYDIVIKNGMQIMSTGSLLRSVVCGLENGESYATVSQRFHQTLIEMLTEMAHRANLETGIKTVVLSGGVFQNQLLFTNLVETLNRKNFNVISHAHIPTNDGCLSFGQSIIGRHHLQNKEKKCV